MSPGNSTLSHGLNVATTSIRGALKPQSVFNSFDELGLTIGLSRLPEEHNADYRTRLLDTYSHRANATYVGLINGITRELGLTLYKPFRISPRKTGDEFIAENPVVIFKGPFIELWRDYNNDVLEMEIDRFEQTESAYNIADLVDLINTESDYFTIDNIDTDTQYNRSMCLLNQSNIFTVIQELIPSTNKFTLTFPGQSGGAIILETVFFNSTNVFNQRVDSIAEVDRSGRYYLDRYTGDIISFDEPEPDTTIRYDYIRELFEPVASPVIIHSLQTDNFKRKMFEELTNDDGTTSFGMMTALGADFINELMSVYPMYYSGP